MLILIIGLIILAGIAMTVGVLHNRQIQKKIESGELKVIAPFRKVCYNSQRDVLYNPCPSGGIVKTTFLVTVAGKCLSE